MRIALFGPPGAGKGTQARLLVKRHRLCHISTGNLLRAAIKDETPIGRQAKGYIDAGLLVPDAIVRVLAEDAIAQQGYNHFILDGYPRTVQQAEWLTAFLAAHGKPLDAVIFFVLPDAVLIDRLSKRRVHKKTGENYHLDYKPPPPEVDPALIIRRPDDEPEAIQERLRVYKEQTRPVEDYYRHKGLLIEVDAVGDFETICERIEHILRVDAF